MTLPAPTTEGPAPRVVSRFEAHLLRLLRSFMRPSEVVTPPAGRLTPPERLSDNAKHLIRDTLAKGCVHYLARAGAWRRVRHLRDGRPAEGRLWERTASAELGLTFSRHTVSFLIWLTAGRPEKDVNWNPPLDELTIGDQYLLFLAYESVRESEAGQTLRTRPQFTRHGLLRLMRPEDFAGNTDALDFAPWVRGLGATILEALQPMLTRRWLELERGKAQVGDWAKMRGIGQSQEQALSAFLTACEAAKRPDLARFLLQALGELLSHDLTPEFWTAGLGESEMPPKLADRLDTKRQALAVLRSVERLAGWTRTWAGTQFFDEDYAIAQSWLADWEQHRGPELAAIAQKLLHQLEPLHTESPAAAVSRKTAKLRET